MTKPTMIPILGTEFKVDYTTKLAKDEYGHTIGNDRSIKIKSALKGEILKATLIHEVCHAILHCSGQSENLTEEQEEAIVVALEHGLTPIFALDISK